MQVAAARSYAKAILALAKEDQTLALWRSFLVMAAQIVSYRRFKKTLLSPMLNTEQCVDLFLSLGEVPKGAENLIRLLMDKKQLIFLNQIAKRFEHYCLLEEKNIVVEVTSATVLTDDQKNKIGQALKRYFEKDITMTVAVDQKLIGGFVARVGDLVIDASVRHSLEQLEKTLF